MTVSPYDAPKEEPQKQEEQVEVGKEAVLADDQDVKLSVARALGLENFSALEKYKDQISRIIEWATLKGAKDKVDIVNSIHQLANRVGTPTLGNNWARHLAQYAYLEMEKLKLDKQLREMEAK